MDPRWLRHLSLQVFLFVVDARSGISPCFELWNSPGSDLLIGVTLVIRKAAISYDSRFVCHISYQSNDLHCVEKGSLVSSNAL